MRPPETSRFLAALGWSQFFEEQLEPAEAELAPFRIASVHRTELAAMSEAGPISLTLPPRANTGEYAVGDWVLADPLTRLVQRRLGRKTILQRPAHGRNTPQLAAANVDTLFIVTSCNADFNVARLERYLAFANEAGTIPVILLTKADTADNPGDYRQQAAGLQRSLPVLIVNARLPETAAALAAWCGEGQTVAVVGSSGVGKSTLVNTLVGRERGASQETGAVRESDAKGRHTTTSRSLHPIAGGGWVIDTPGIRTLHLSDVSGGIETLFAEITELSHQCKFRDCTHSHEPGCAVQSALATGHLDPDRVTRWRKLQTENSSRSTPQGGPASGHPKRR
ncbi:MAG: ribosome small subunit-dependent GTPase [Devosia sp.]|uniref:ribosome small subunit-dependent GTPase A n=1 Tax=Devosia sp. TaxID=1871048 RepID=UPI002612F643|nr:ribosome small subunit-dependent GTPase A [Devosia sp.]MDB5541571.1 ribosome small subunit-dependent GTPase [Devosia sp.]